MALARAGARLLKGLGLQAPDLAYPSTAPLTFVSNSVNGIDGESSARAWMSG